MQQNLQCVRWKMFNWKSGVSVRRFCRFCDTQQQGSFAISALCRRPKASPHSVPEPGCDILTMCDRLIFFFLTARKPVLLHIANFAGGLTDNMLLQSTSFTNHFKFCCTSQKSDHRSALAIACKDVQDLNLHSHKPHFLI